MIKEKPIYGLMAEFETPEQVLQAALRTQHDTYGTWKSLEVFDPLTQLADRLLKFGGIEIQNRPDGNGRVLIPLHLETIPSVEEQAAYLAEKLATQ